jgi:hypothetical protein
MTITRLASGLIVALVAVLSQVQAAAAQTVDRQRDRGAGIPLSMFGTYILPREFIVYPFFEYYRDKNSEYSPDELGYGLVEDFRAPYRASEGLIFLGYGLSDRLAIEFEVAVISARQDKAANDPSNMPAVLEESGLGDVEGQLRWRWNRETDSKPEYFSYFETVFPLQKDKVLIGTSAWEFKLGTGVVRGFSWGTTTFRAAVEYDDADKKVGLGEYAIEYLRRISPLLQLFAGVEGSEDEVELITEAQVSLARGIVLKLNSAFGVTPKATDWAPEIGVFFRFR